MLALVTLVANKGATRGELRGLHSPPSQAKLEKKDRSFNF